MKCSVPNPYDGIDYGFRLDSFWAATPDPLTAVPRNVKGRNRREMIRDYYTAGKLDELCIELLNDSLDVGSHSENQLAIHRVPRFHFRSLEV